MIDKRNPAKVTNEEETVEGENKAETTDLAERQGKASNGR